MYLFVYLYIYIYTCIYIYDIYINIYIYIYAHYYLSRSIIPALYIDYYPILIFLFQCDYPIFLLRITISNNICFGYSIIYSPGIVTV